MSDSSFNFPIVESCNGCGVCCHVQGAPPDFVALSLNPHFREDPSFAEDVERFDQLSGEPRDLLSAYLKQSAAGEIPTDGPCVWLDAKKEQCRFYDQRPSTCRVFEVNSPGCHFYRKLSGIEGYS
ncbi:YkgJ family cysteine cluster protein [Thalassoglobus polymorphus]|uniref:Flagellin N-methylase n=1 Tax=Thalassoglobus polymorphus TaxID=2527994 RepID=A0A517QSV6_9PLAN|nr:YkgJ family cysteine cluster protein [Thalassoglobus polymorphus]QDT34701.1 Flagellin N-methylase [Thalassoglobus polymorphus]